MEKYELTFTPSLRERKRILKHIYKNSTRKRIAVASTIGLLTIVFGIIAFIAMLLYEHPTSTYGIIIFALAGMCFESIPLAFMVSINTVEKYKGGLPYSSYANGTLTIQDNKLEYSFWRVGREEPAAYSSKRAVYREADKFIYRINLEDINSIILKNDTCTIYGWANTEMPDWAIEDETVKEQPREFSFALAFEQENTEEQIRNWVDRNARRVKAIWNKS